MTKSTFTQKVLAFLKGGEEAKMERFSAKLSKYLSKQKSMRLDQIETLREKIADANEALEETILNVNLDSVNKTESVEGYIPSYLRRVKEAKATVEILEEQIETLEEEIAEFESLDSLIFQENTLSA